MLWACFASCLSACDCCCTFLCHKLCLQRRMRRRRRRRRRRRHHRRRKVDIEVFDTSSTEAEEDHGNVEASFSLRDHDYDLYKVKSGSLSGRRRDYRGDQLRKSLRPRNHRIGAGISRDLGRHGSRRSSVKRNHDHNSRVDHGIRVTRTSKFVRKGTIYTGGVQRRRSQTMGDDHDQATKQPNDDHDHDHHHHQHRPQRVPLTRSQLRSDDLLNMAAHLEQERAFPNTLETIESDDSESDTTETSSSYTYALEREDYEFFEDSRFDAAGLGFLEDDEDEDMEEYDEDDDDDELDVDELTYEELIALGEFIGVEKRGLSVKEISSCLHPIVWKTTSSVDRARNGVDRCVVCQVEFEEGEELVGMPCDHPYHSECISKWLQIKKSCPICTTEVVIPNPNSSKNVKFVS